MMNQEDIFKKIGHILNELNEQYQYLAQNPAELNELELELFLANANFLSDHVQIVRKLNTVPAPKVLPEHTATVTDNVEQLPVVSLEAEPIAEQQFVHTAAPVVAEPIAKSIVDDQPVQESTPVTEPISKPIVEQEMFKLDNESSSFEFILNEKPYSDRFEFEEKSVDEIFDRPLSREEEEIIAQKQKLRESDSLESETTEEDEIGPEPFLVSSVEHNSAVTEEMVSEKEAAAPAQQTEELPIPQQELNVPVIEKEEAPEVKADTHIQEEAPKFVKDDLFRTSVSEFTPASPEPTFAEQPIQESAAPVKLTLNDILSGNSQHSAVKPENHRAPISDLKQAISLNDKLRYIRDLFNGYNLAYAEAIDLLNKMPDFKTADAFLQNNYAVKHNWADKQETADQFYELLNQRFPAK